MKKRFLWQSFYFAIRGIGFVIATERNFKIHILVAFLIFLLGFFLKITKLEWFALVFSIFLVLILEAINTAIEISVDLTTKKKRLRAMLAKDISAGAVLLAVINAIIIGLIVFSNRLLSLTYF